jgi:transcriptional regulator with XRE-family HTH domain
MHCVPHFGANLRRLMARDGLTVEQVVRLTALDERTVKGILAGRHRPHARTIYRLAAGLGVPADEFFQDPSLLVHKWFDRQTNPIVDQVVDEHSELFHGWTESDFAELYSRFGTGGALTVDGVVEAARRMAHHRQVQRKVALILETSEATLLASLVDLVYERIRVIPEPCRPQMMDLHQARGDEGRIPYGCNSISNNCASSSD